MAIKKLEILNYRNERIPIEIDMAEVRDIRLRVLSGDETLEVNYYNGSSKLIDPMSEYRFDVFHDGSYCIYKMTDTDDIYDLTEDPKWLGRKTAYEYPDRLLLGIK